MAVSCWSDLHSDLLEQVAIKLNEIEDFTAFRGVCTSWRGAVAKDKFVSNHKLPLLMFPPRGGDSDVCEFYSLRKKKIVSRMSVPELKGKRRSCVGFGWILTIALSSGEVSLVNLMSSANIQLPNLNTFTGYEDCYSSILDFWYSNHKAVLSANPSQTSDFNLVIFCLNIFCLWRNGDNKWTKIDIFKHCPVIDICYYKHKVYFTNSKKLHIWDPSLNQTLSYSFTGLTKQGYPYLVESSKGELVLILRHYNVPGNYFTAFHIDTEKRKFNEIKNLDGDAIFIDKESIVSVAAADFPSIVEANCIYYYDNRKRHASLIRIYNVELESAAYARLGVQYHYSSHWPPQWLL